jgi:2-dehydropantoate 2-reductase
MRILVIGYFGARLLAAGCDVRFLVRPRRAAQLAADGLRVRSGKGDLALKNPPTVLADNLRAPYDAILLSCKAYDLDDAIASFAPAVGAKTVIVPLLNGMRHLDVLDARFGVDRVLGGRCRIAATLAEDGTVVHLNDFSELSYGARVPAQADAVAAIEREMEKAAFDSHVADDIIQEMWEKWVFLATTAGMTCLMRAAIGDILRAPGGRDTMLAFAAECQAIAEAHGYRPLPAAEKSRALLTAEGSTMTASMLRDIERGGPVEADHVVGDLLDRGARAGLDTPLLALAYTHLKAYEARRERERTTAR